MTPFFQVLVINSLLKNIFEQGKSLKVEHDIFWCILAEARTQRRHCLHGRGFICNRIGFNALMPFVYMAPVEFVIRTGSFWIRFQKLSVFKTIRFRGRVNGETASIRKWSGSKLAGSRSKYGKSRMECFLVFYYKPRAIPNNRQICLEMLTLSSISSCRVTKRKGWIRPGELSLRTRVWPNLAPIDEAQRPKNEIAGWIGSV